MAILQLQEGGRLQMLYNHWWKNAGSCSGDESKAEKKKAHSLGVANVGGTFVILIAGIACAAAVAVVEFVWYNLRSAHRSANHDNQVGSAPSTGGLEGGVGADPLCQCQCQWVDLYRGVQSMLNDIRRRGAGTIFNW